MLRSRADVVKQKQEAILYCQTIVLLMVGPSSFHLDIVTDLSRLLITDTT